MVLSFTALRLHGGVDALYFPLQMLYYFLEEDQNIILICHKYTQNGTNQQHCRTYRSCRSGQRGSSMQLGMEL